jgi:hypothetical protein
MADVDDRQAGPSGGRELDRFVERGASVLGAVGGNQDLLHENSFDSAAGRAIRVEADLGAENPKAGSGRLLMADGPRATRVRVRRKEEP